ncbi:hypothetical protein [Jeotgalibacillus salarius]|nr:hypothetical protein [Jeotgalibacillus salarius]
MRMIVICPGCRGSGSVKKAGLLLRKCSECNGSGKISKTLAEYKMN